MTRTLNSGGFTLLPPSGHQVGGKNTLGGRNLPPRGIASRDRRSQRRFGNIKSLPSPSVHFGAAHSVTGAVIGRVCAQDEHRLPLNLPAGLAETCKSKISAAHQVTAARACGQGRGSFSFVKVPNRRILCPGWWRARWICSRNHCLFMEISCKPCQGKR